MKWAAPDKQGEIAQCICRTVFFSSACMYQPTALIYTCPGVCQFCPTQNMLSPVLNSVSAVVCLQSPCGICLSTKYTHLTPLQHPGPRPRGLLSQERSPLPSELCCPFWDPLWLPIKPVDFGKGAEWQEFSVCFAGLCREGVGGKKNNSVCEFV